MNDDATIIRSIVKKGNRRAYGELVEKYSSLVFSTCLSILGNREDAADITQDAFVKAYEILSDLREPEKYSLWLRRIAVGLSKNLLRSNSRRTNRLHALADRKPENTEPRAEPSAVVSAREQSDIVRRHICALPERYRTVIVLKYLEELRYADIASFLDLSLRTVKLLAFEAKRLLMARLKKEGLVNVPLLRAQRA